MKESASFTNTLAWFTPNDLTLFNRSEVITSWRLFWLDSRLAFEWVVGNRALLTSAGHKKRTQEILQLQWNPFPQASQMKCFFLKRFTFKVYTLIDIQWLTKMKCFISISLVCFKYKNVFLRKINFHIFQAYRQSPHSCTIVDDYIFLLRANL